MPAKPQKFRFMLPSGLTPKERLAIGQDVITFIQTTAINKNKGFNRDTGRYRQFPAYTKAYAKKKRTSPGNVDLVLSADMFNAMGVTVNRPDSVTIGFLDPSQNGKAEGNQIGSYGRSPNPRKARPFLGISKKELDRIVDKVRGVNVSEE